MEEGAKTESHLSSAAAFVEGGIQDACDDACSICLEAFCDSDPSTVTNCKHEFHLQCILEWCQRSSQCPMCWQSISLKDPTSQELLEAVERERNIRVNSERSNIFHLTTLGDFELQHLPIGASDSELEERILQHLAAAAAMGRAHHIVRREGQRGRSGVEGRPQFLVFSTHPNTSSGSVSTSSSQRAGEGETDPAIVADSPSAPLSDTGEEPLQQPPHMIAGPADHVTSMPSVASVTISSRPGLSNSRSTVVQSSAAGNNRAGPSDFQSFSESLKSRFGAVSMRYKESIAKSTRGWKERLFSRNSSMAELGSEVRREVNAGIATVSRMMERLDTREGTKAASASISHATEGHLTREPSNDSIAEDSVAEDHRNVSSCESNTSPSCAATSGSN